MWVWVQQAKDHVPSSQTKRLLSLMTRAHNNYQSDISYGQFKEWNGIMERNNDPSRMHPFSHPFDN